MEDQAAPAASPEFMLTYKTFYGQIEKPLCVINLDLPLPAFKLVNHLKTIHNAISRECTEFIRGKPKLPETSMMRSIGLKTVNRALVKVCFCLKNLYVMGAHVGDTFYEKKEGVLSPSLVEGSVPLGRGGDTYAAYGVHPPLTLSAHAQENGYHSLADLGTLNQDLAAALYALGIIALTLIEPLRQSTPKRLLVGECGRHKRGPVLTAIASDNMFWAVTHRWGANCLTAQGLVRDGSIDGNEENRAVREDEAVNYKERWDAMDEVLVFNMGPRITYAV